MTSQFKKFLAALIIVFALVVGHWSARQWALRMMPTIDRCDRPCQWQNGKGFVSCQPLTATLDVKTSPKPNGRGQAVWFRTTTTNQSCQTVLLNTQFFAPSGDYAQTGNLIITDEYGRPVPTGYYEDAGRGVLDAENDIHPYVRDNAAVQSLIRYTPDSSGGFSFVYLEPGQTVVSGSTRLAPYRMKYIEAETKGYKGTAAIPEPISIAHAERLYAAPPPGFRNLVGFDLRRPGRYHAIFIIKGELPVERYDDPRTPIHNRLRRIVYAFATGWANERGNHVNVDILSPPVAFEIKP